MQLLLANAKLMHTHTALQPKGTPTFQDLSNAIAMEMALRDISALERDLGCSRKLAAEVWRYYQDFGHAEKMPALAAYNGHAYKHLGVGDFAEADWNFAEQHLWITCFYMACCALWMVLFPIEWNTMCDCKWQTDVRCMRCGRNHSPIC